MKRIIAFLIILLSFSCLQAVSVHTQIDKETTNLKNLRIGDRIFLTVDIEHETKDSVVLDNKFIQELSQTSEFVTVSSQKQTRKTEKKFHTIFDIQTTFFETGEQTIPAMKFIIFTNKDSSAVYSDSIAVQIQSTITSDSTAGKIRDIVGPLPVRLTVWDILFPVAILIFIVLVILFFIKKKSGKSIIPTKKKKLIPAHVIALAKLDQLELDKLPQQGKIKEYFVRLSWICREYLENRYKLPVLESTSTEIKRLLKKNNVKLQAKFYNFLIECDQVKYARFSKTIAESGEIKATLKNLIIKTRTQTQTNDDEHNISKS